jgi:hypothetical protein
MFSAHCCVMQLMQACLILLMILSSSMAFRSAVRAVSGRQIARGLTSAVLASALQQAVVCRYQLPQRNTPRHLQSRLYAKSAAKRSSKSTRQNDPKDIDDDSELNSDSDDEPAAKRRRPLQTDANIALLLEQCALQNAFDAAYSSAAGRRVLGLDINTSSTGYAVLDIASSTSSSSEADAAAAVLLEWGRICTKKADDVLDGGLEITAQLSDIKQRCCSSSGDAPWIVGVEDFAKSFTTGRFHTRSLFKLAQLNGIVKFGCLQTFAVKPDAWHPTSARAFYGLKRGKVSDYITFPYIHHSYSSQYTEARVNA